jgi:hypothetical protein
MIWGKTAKACGTAGGMDNGVPIDWVGGSAQESLSTRRILKKMMLLLLLTDRFLHLQATLLKARSKTPPTPVQRRDVVDEREYDIVIYFIIQYV